MQVRFEKCNDCCVWMNAGVLSYKRCDRNFDCEHCPLDSVLQREFPRPASQSDENLRIVSVSVPGSIPEAAAELLKPYTKTILHADYRYTPGRLWIQQLPGDYYRIGIDAFLLRILPKNSDVITLAAGSETQKESPLGWIYLGGFTLPLLSPIPGAIVRRNGAFGKITNDVRNSPYDHGWLAVIKADSSVLSGSLPTVDAAAAHMHSMMTEYIDSASKALQHPEELGLCLNDGGQIVENLEMAFGEDAYRHFVVEKLNGGAQ